MPRKAAGDGPTWAPATHLGDWDVVLGSWLWPEPELAVADIWGSELANEKISVTLPFKSKTREIQVRNEKSQNDFRYRKPVFILHSTIRLMP